MLTSLVLLFVALFGISFAIVVVLLKPTRSQQVVDSRLNQVMERRLAFARGIAMPPATLVRSERNHFPALEAQLASTHLGHKLRRLFDQTGRHQSLASTLLLSVGLMFAIAVVAWYSTGLLPIAVLLGVVASALPFIVAVRRRARRLAAFEAALPETVELAARALRAGHSIVGAIELMATQASEPVRGEFAQVFKQQNYGLPLREALTQLLDRVPSDDLRVMVTGVLVQRESGGNLAEILDSIAAVTRDRRRLVGEIRTHTAQGRMTGWILALLPLILLAMVNIINPGYSRVMFTDPTGKKLLYLMVVLLGLGALSIRSIVRGIEAQ